MAVPAGIPTRYRQARFRSRLEARWGSFFDLIGWRWTYEPLEVDGYIPDFLIHGDRPFFVEVGPCILQADFQSKSAKPDAAAAQLGHDVLIVGVNPIADVHATMGSAVGWLGEYGSFAVSEFEGVVSPPGVVMSWGPGVWSSCTVCRGYIVIHDFMSWAHRPCDHGDGDHNLGLVNPYTLDDLWNLAGSTTQWKPRWR